MNTNYKDEQIKLNDGKNKKIQGINDENKKKFEEIQTKEKEIKNKSEKLNDKNYLMLVKVL